MEAVDETVRIGLQKTLSIFWRRALRLKQPLFPRPLCLPPAASPRVPRCLFGAVLLLALLAVALPLAAEDAVNAANAGTAGGAGGAKLVGLGGVWVANGPAPTTEDLVHVAPDNSVDGAVHVVPVEDTPAAA